MGRPLLSPANTVALSLCEHPASQHSGLALLTRPVAPSLPWRSCAASIPARPPASTVYSRNTSAAAYVGSTIGATTDSFSSTSISPGWFDSNTFATSWEIAAAPGTDPLWLTSITFNLQAPAANGNTGVTLWVLPDCGLSGSTSALTAILPSAANAVNWYSYGYYFTLNQVGVGPMTFDLTSVDAAHPGLTPGSPNPNMTIIQPGTAVYFYIVMQGGATTQANSRIQRWWNSNSYNGYGQYGNPGSAPYGGQCPCSGTVCSSAAGPCSGSGVQYVPNLRPNEVAYTDGALQARVRRLAPRLPAPHCEQSLDQPVRLVLTSAPRRLHFPGHGRTGEDGVLVQRGGDAGLHGDVRDAGGRPAAQLPQLQLRRQRPPAQHANQLPARSM